MTVPNGCIAICCECGQPIWTFTPYRMIRPGHFAHLLHLVRPKSKGVPAERERSA